jgi:protein-S-isoprenylcysteine O-methyltransferase Ste14
LKRSRLAAPATRAIVVLTLGLWCEEFYEDATDPRWLPPSLGNLLDCAMVCLTVWLIVWLTHEHFARLHADIRRRDQQVADLSNFANVAVQRLETGEPQGATPLRSVNGKNRLG